MTAKHLAATISFQPHYRRGPPFGGRGPLLFSRIGTVGWHVVDGSKAEWSERDPLFEGQADKVQEEVFVVVSGTLTMQLGDPPERVDVGAPGLVAVEPGTPLLVRNESDEDLVLYIYGAPAEQGGADFFEDTGDL
jgi:Cupin domain